MCLSTACQQRCREWRVGLLRSESVPQRRELLEGGTRCGQQFVLRRRSGHAIILNDPNGTGRMDWRHPWRRDHVCRPALRVNPWSSCRAIPVSNTLPLAAIFGSTRPADIRGLPVALHLAVNVKSLVHEAGQKMGWTVE